MGTWYGNLQTTIRFQDWEYPLSRPGCWAYPDMLQVGRLGCDSTTSGCSRPDFIAWTRTHFAAYCIVSSPLVLSIFPSDEVLSPILDIIGNKQAMAVNQAWAGHPGTLVRTLPAIINNTTMASTVCKKGQMPGGDIYRANLTVAEGVVWCSSNSKCAGFTAEAPGACHSTEVLDLHFKDSWGAHRPDGISALESRESTCAIVIFLESDGVFRQYQLDQLGCGWPPASAGPTLGQNSWKRKDCRAVHQWWS